MATKQVCWSTGFRKVGGAPWALPPGPALTSKSLDTLIVQVRSTSHVSAMPHIKIAVIR